MSPDTQTHTLPLALMAVLVLLGVAALGLLYYRKRQLQGTVEGQFKDFREKAVALMDQLDALRQRHKTLPSTDPDFTAPMSGATTRRLWSKSISEVSVCCRSCAF